MRHIRNIVLAVAFVATSLTPAAAMKQMTKSVSGSGGEESMSTKYGMMGTAGQAVIGETNGNGHVKMIGYWYTPGATATAIGDQPRLEPIRFQLHQNYPNPFNPTTTIQFDLPEAGPATLLVYDAAGRRVTTLVNKQLKRGIHKVVFDASDLASGVYFYQIRAGRFVQSKKLILLK